MGFRDLPSFREKHGYFSMPLYYTLRFLGEKSAWYKQGITVVTEGHWLAKTGQSDPENETSSRKHAYIILTPLNPTCI